MKLNNKGFSLMEQLACMIIIGILVSVMLSLFSLANRKIAKLIKLINIPVTSAASLVAKVIPVNSSTCTPIEDTYYAKASGTDTLNIYTNSTCTTSFGNLNRLNNPSWFDENTYTDWWTYSFGGVLKVRLVQYRKAS